MNKNRVFVILLAGAAVAIFLALSLLPKPAAEGPEDASLSKLLVKPHSPAKGADEAKIAVVEFLDPECEACRAMHPIVGRLLSEYEGKVRLVIRYMPFHENSLQAACALEEAREVGKYEEALSLLFEKQPEWADHAQPRPDLIAVFLKELGIDEGRLGRENLIQKHGWKINLDRTDGEQLGVKRTPTFFVNGRMLNEIGYDPLKEAVEFELSRMKGGAK